SVAIGCNLSAQGRLAPLFAPALAIGDKESLVARKAIADDIGLAIEREVVGIEGNGQAGEIGNVFAQRLLSIHRQIGEGTILIVLGGQRLACGLEMLEVRLRPPVSQAAAGVELTPLIIEAMADFVANGRSDRAVVTRGIGSRIKVWRLKDCRWEVKRVLQR